MDPVFDAVDRAMDVVRRRYPGSLFAATLLLWVGAMVLLVFFLGWENTLVSWWIATMLAVPPVGLLALVARRGIRRVDYAVWLAGLLPMMFVAAGIAMEKESWEEWASSTGAVLAFVYAQVFLGALAALDELHSRRAGGQVRREPDPVVRWRTLQAKVLAGTLFLFALATLSLNSGSFSDPVGAPARQLFGMALSAVCLPILVGAWARFRPFAWFAAVMIPTVYLIGVLSVSPADRTVLVLNYGWLIAATTWLWTKAAVVAYWPLPVRPATLSPSPAANSDGLAGMVLGFVAVPTACCYGIGIPIGIGAIVLGALGLRKVKRGLATNRSQAVTGLVCGIAAVMLGVCVVLEFVR